MSQTTNRKLKRVEMKFQLDATLSGQVRNWARDRLGVDTNCNSDSGDTYDISTLYLDTRELDIYHRTGRIGQAKHRVRRYGDEQTLWLETKRKKKMVVRKNRTAVFESDYLSRSTVSSADSWCGDWFLDRIASRQLQPTVQITYRRFARVGTLHGESMRLTIDSEMYASKVQGWHVGQRSGSRSDTTSFGDCEVLELKFHNSMPWLFKDLLQTFTIPPTGFSKYRSAIAARDLLETVNA